jgi:hypothetical protein
MAKQGQTTNQGLEGLTAAVREAIMPHWEVTLEKDAVHPAG